jgi:hypothetical protein
VVINDFNGTWAKFSPCETHAPLIVNADAPLTLPVTREFFKPVSRRRTQECQRLRRIQLCQFTFGNGQDWSETPRTSSLELSLQENDRIMANRMLREA